MSQRMFDERSKGYENSWHPNFAKYMVGVADIQPGEHILDLACGTGLCTFPALIATGPNGYVVGVDVSKGMLAEAEAKKSMVEGGDRVELYQHDISRIDTLDAIMGKSFDVIIIASALVLLDDPITAIRLWKTFLKSGGRFIVDVLTPYNQPSGLVLEKTCIRLTGHAPFNRRWVRSEASVRDAVAASGLHVENVIPTGQFGHGTKFLDIADADKELERYHGQAVFKTLADYGNLEEVRKVFREEWPKMAVDGKVKSEDLVWVVVARNL